MILVMMVLVIAVLFMVVMMMLVIVIVVVEVVMSKVVGGDEALGVNVSQHVVVSFRFFVLCHKGSHSETDYRGRGCLDVPRGCLDVPL